MPLPPMLTIMAALSVLAPAQAMVERQADPTAAASVPPAPALNHLYVVLDAASFAAIRDSRELARLLGRSDGGLPEYAPPAGDADRIFFRGRETYLELFAPENGFREPVGKVGVALGHDDPDDLDALEAAWGITCPTTIRRTPVEFRRIHPPVPWYDALQCDETAGGDHLAVWAMSYRRQFHRWQSGAVLPVLANPSRRDILAPRAVDGQGRFDVTGLSLQVTRATFDTLVAQLTDAGFGRQHTVDGALLRGEDWTLWLRVSEAPPRLLGIAMATEDLPPERLALGKGVLLRTGSRTATWFPNDGPD